jgi:hypothetical protein
VKTDSFLELAKSTEVDIARAKAVLPKTEITEIEVQAEATPFMTAAAVPALL